jgi:hypothetical protein
VSTLRWGRVARAREEMICIVIAGIREASRGGGGIGDDGGILGCS